jgi:hypothetical protein
LLSLALASAASCARLPMRKKTLVGATWSTTPTTQVLGHAVLVIICVALAVFTVTCGGQNAVSIQGPR